MPSYISRYYKLSKENITMSGESVKYVTFGGAQVPESSTRTVTQQNGKTTYNVWIEGAKISYPQQHEKPVDYDNTEYAYRAAHYNILKNEFEMYEKSLSKFEYDWYVDNYWNNNNGEYEARLKTGKNYQSLQVDRNASGTFVVEAYPVSTTPQIEASTEGILFKTQNITVSNIQGATITGSVNEDNITLNNSSNCTVDVSNANNNFFISDNVTIVNGKNNSVKAGDNDTVTYQTHNYETDTDKTTASYEDEGKYKQK